MSTRSNIAVVLPKEMVGITKKQNFNLLYAEEETKDNTDLDEINLKELSVEHEKEISIQHNCLKIYHHWDGYPTGVGLTLIKHYNESEKALNLCLMGDFSTINSYPSKYGKPEDLINEPQQFDMDLSINKWKSQFQQNGWEEFVYIYDYTKQRWYVLDIYKQYNKSGKFVSVETAIRNELLHNLMCWSEELYKESLLLVYNLAKESLGITNEKTFDVIKVTDKLADISIGKFIKETVESRIK